MRIIRISTNFIYLFGAVDFISLTILVPKIIPTPLNPINTNRAASGGDVQITHELASFLFIRLKTITTNYIYLFPIVNFISSTVNTSS
jgi:hypothetical protein